MRRKREGTRTIRAIDRSIHHDPVVVGPCGVLMQLISSSESEHTLHVGKLEMQSSVTMGKWNRNGNLVRRIMI